jgi:hypothetical protein
MAVDSVVDTVISNKMKTATAKSSLEGRYSEYCPSDELQIIAAFANLPDGTRYEEQAIKQELEGNYDTFLSRTSIFLRLKFFSFPFRSQAVQVTKTKHIKDDHRNTSTTGA